MARTAKIPKNEIEIEDAPVVDVEMTQDEVEVAPKKEEKYSIADDPYLSDEQKDVLFEYEFNKMLKNMVTLSTDPYTGTIMRFPNGTAAFVPAKGGLKAIWEYYSLHIRGGTVDDFLARLKKSYGDKFKWINVTTLELNG